MFTRFYLVAFKPKQLMIVPSFSFIVVWVASELLQCQWDYLSICCCPAIVASVKVYIVSHLVHRHYSLPQWCPPWYLSWVLFSPGHSPMQLLLLQRYFQIFSFSLFHSLHLSLCPFLLFSLSANICNFLGGIKNRSCSLTKPDGNICMLLGPV